MGRNDTALVIGALVCCIIVLSVVYYSTRQVERTTQDTGADWPAVAFNTTGEGQYLNLTVYIVEGDWDTDLDSIRIGVDDQGFTTPLSELSHPNITYIDSDGDGRLSKGDVISIDGSFWDAGHRIHLYDKHGRGFL